MGLTVSIALKRGTEGCAIKSLFSADDPAAGIDRNKDDTFDPIPSENISGLARIGAIWCIKLTSEAVGP